MDAGGAGRSDWGGGGSDAPGGGWDCAGRRRGSAGAARSVQAVRVGGGGAAVSAIAPSPGAGTATGRGTITVPNWSQVRPSSGAIQPGMVKLSRHMPGPVPPTLGGSGIAG